MVEYLSKEAYIEDVLFLNPAIWFEHVIRNPFTEFTRLRRSYWQSVCARKVGKNITVFTPLFLPKLQKLGEKRICGKVARYTQNPYILLVNVPILYNSSFIELLQNAALTLFDWSDDFAQFASGCEEQKRTQESINNIIKKADIVFTVNETLLERAKAINENSYCIRNATNLAMFPIFSLKRKKKKRPVIGYTGWLVPDRLDVELIHFCARSLPEYDFLFVGPKVSADPLHLKEAPRNVYYQRAVKYEKLAAVIENFDVCIIPNKVNDHTKGNDPIKIYDYLFMGKPVVTTETAGVKDFTELISICTTREAFLQAIKKYIEYDTLEIVTARKKAGFEHSWDMKIDSVRKMIQLKLGFA
jgi:glycosyltransferase involved in cell wall biosynthesis